MFHYVSLCFTMFHYVSLCFTVNPKEKNKTDSKLLTATAGSAGHQAPGNGGPLFVAVPNSHLRRARTTGDTGETAAEMVSRRKYKVNQSYKLQVHSVLTFTLAIPILMYALVPGNTGHVQILVVPSIQLSCCPPS